MKTGKRTRKKQEKKGWGRVGSEKKRGEGEQGRKKKGGRRKEGERAYRYRLALENDGRGVAEYLKNVQVKPILIVHSLSRIGMRIIMT